jgi:hypothetical protein
LGVFAVPGLVVAVVAELEAKLDASLDVVGAELSSCFLLVGLEQRFSGSKIDGAL